MLIRDVAAIVFYNERDEILLQKKDLLFRRWPGCWSLFGGGIEQNENPADAIKREIKEELDYLLQDFKLLFIYDYKDADREGKMYVYSAKFNQPLSSLSIHEGAGFAFFSEEEIYKLKLIDHDLEILRKYLENNIK